MGLTHNELTGRAGFFSRALRNALQVESGDVGVDRVSETLTPTIDLYSRPEWALLRGERLWHIAPSTPALAANFSSVGVFNPAGSGLIIVVEAFRMGDHSGANSTLHLRMGANVAFTATSNANSRDTRTALISGVVCGSFSHQAAAEIGFLCQLIRLADQAYSEFPLNIVLTPGFFLGLGPEAINQIAAATFYGYERPAFAGELTARA